MKIKNIAYYLLIALLFPSFVFADSKPIKIAPDYVGTITYSGEYNYYARNPRQKSANAIPDAESGSYFDDNGTGIAVYKVYYEGDKFVANLISNSIVRGRTLKTLPEKIEGVRKGTLCKPNEGERFYCTNEIFLLDSKGDLNVNNGVSYNLRAKPINVSMN